MEEKSKRFVRLVFEPSMRQRRSLKKLIRLVQKGGEADISKLPRSFRRAVQHSRYLRMVNSVYFYQGSFAFDRRGLRIKNFGWIPLPEGVDYSEIKSVSLYFDNHSNSSLMGAYLSLKEVNKK